MGHNSPGFEGPRGTRPDETKRVIELVNRVFRGDVEGDMYGRFPVLFGDENLGNCRIVLDGGRPVSHIAYLPRQAVIGGPTISVACMGAVCTDEEYRGRGIASRILDDCERRMQEQGVDVVIISGGRGLYLRWGARTVGERHEYRITREDAPALADDSMTVRPGGPDDTPVLAALYDTNPVRFVRSQEDWHTWLTAGRCSNAAGCPMIGHIDGKAVAYVVHNYENIRRELISGAGEWAGEPQHVAGILAVLATERERDHVEVSADPIPDGRLVRVLDDAGIHRKVTHFGATVRVLRPSALFEKLRARLDPPACDVRMTDVGGGARLELGAAELALSAEDVARAFFGDPEGAVPKKFDAAGALRRAMLDTFPLPLPHYGYNYA